MVLVWPHVPAGEAKFVCSLEENDVTSLLLVLPTAGVHGVHSVVVRELLVLQLHLRAAGDGGSGPLPSEGAGGIFLFDPLDKHTVGVGVDWPCRGCPSAEFVENSASLGAKSDLEIILIATSSKCDGLNQVIR